MFKCEVCDSNYNSKSGLNKHHRIKHINIPKKKPVKKNIYFCNSCEDSFDLKANLIKHVRTHLNDQRLNMICSFENCTKSFFTMTGLIEHLKSHNINVESNLLNFNTIEVFYRKFFFDEFLCDLAEGISFNIIEDLNVS
ncbi:zinc finger protein 34-like [Melanaphis sacchari]|uniref:Zinc finger protein 777 n=1 Tax=Melanaphis sacchari TaxID=742174 RepID=A0A2H8TR16_9HEMI|nr:zinc finger protein 34-like [Melanaphis sacchari]